MVSDTVGLEVRFTLDSKVFKSSGNTACEEKVTLAGTQKLDCREPEE